MSIQYVSPSAVTHLRGSFCRVYDISEEYGGEHTVNLYKAVALR